jgi:hypothetical protein
MKLWVIDLKYLSNDRLKKLWYDGVVAMEVFDDLDKVCYVEGYNPKHKYLNHPDLERFKKSKNPVIMIRSYLSGVLMEINKRGIDFEGNFKQLDFFHFWRHFDLFYDFVKSDYEDNKVKVSNNEVIKDFNQLKEIYKNYDNNIEWYNKINDIKEPNHYDFLFKEN